MTAIVQMLKATGEKSQVTQKPSSPMMALEVLVRYQVDDPIDSVRVDENRKGVYVALLLVARLTKHRYDENQEYHDEI